MRDDQCETIQTTWGSSIQPSIHREMPVPITCASTTEVSAINTNSKIKFFFISKFKSNLSNKLSVNNTCDAKRTHFVVSVLTTCRLLLLVCKWKVVPAVNFALDRVDRLIRVQFKTEKLKCWNQMLLPASKKFYLHPMRLDLMIPGLKGQCSAY